jgi:hypothetical protein
MVKKWLQLYIGAVQRCVIAVALFLLYIVGFGITALFLRTFRKGMPGVRQRRPGTCWRAAEGYAESLQDSLRGS